MSQRPRLYIPHDACSVSTPRRCVDDRANSMTDRLNASWTPQSRECRLVKPEASSPHQLKPLKVVDEIVPGSVTGTDVNPDAAALLPETDHERARRATAQTHRSRGTHTIRAFAGDTRNASGAEFRSLAEGASKPRPTDSSQLYGRGNHRLDGGSPVSIPPVTATQHVVEHGS